MDKAPTIRIRMAQPTDLYGICLLVEQLGYPASEEQIQVRLNALLDDVNHALFIAALKDNQICGWVHGFIRRLIVVDCHLAIGGVVVEEQFRSQGIGTMLMAAIEQWAIEKGVKFVFVRSNINREEAHRFYESIGYVLLKTSQSFRKQIAP